MDLIKKIYLRKLTNGEHNLFVTRVLNRAKEDEHVCAKCNNLIEGLKTALEQEDADLRISRKSQWTDKINAVIRVCNAYYTTYKRGVQDALLAKKHLKEAERLEQHIKDYGITHRTRMLDRVGTMTNFIEDLQGKYASEIEVFSFGSLVENMKEMNDRACRFLTYRNDEQASIPRAAVYHSRLATDEAYSLLEKK